GSRRAGLPPRRHSWDTSRFHTSIGGPCVPRLGRRDCHLRGRTHLSGPAQTLRLLLEGNEMDALRNEMSNYIPWILAFHLIAVIAWMSAMLYLPRLFVYHAETSPGSESSERFKVMERRLLKAIMNPAMIAVWILGPLLAWLTGAYLDTWLQIKF